MTSDNETVEDACKVLRAYPKAEASDCSGLVVLNNTAIADRIEAAHRREVAELEAKLSNTETARKFFARRLDSAKEKVAELRECLKETIYASCVKCTLYNSRRRQCSYSSGACDDVAKWRKALGGAKDETAI